MKLNLINLVNLYDSKNKSDSLDVSSITGIMGEELATSLFCDFIKRKKLGFINEIINQCNLGSNIGNRLDRWICVEYNENQFLFQTEIKNWSSHSKNGKKYPDNKNELENFRINRWEKDYDVQKNKFKNDNCNKVLIPMKYTGDYKNYSVTPLVIFWDSMHPDGSNEEFFKVRIDNDNFKELYIFSMSSYVHNLINEKIDEIEIDLKITERRIKKIMEVIQLYI